MHSRLPGHRRTGTPSYRDTLLRDTFPEIWFHPTQMPPSYRDTPSYWDTLAKSPRCPGKRECTVLSIIFCALTLFVLVYYIRRRYKLYEEINRIPQELLIKDSYRNHLKNLKIKCIINNFIIVILVMEFVQNFGQIFVFFLSAITNSVMNLSLREIEYSFSLFTIPIYYSLVPVLYTLMYFLWLAYRKYEYKYTIIRWKRYIVIRIFLIYLVETNIIIIPLDYQLI